jgi:hypothetical protein
MSKGPNHKETSVTKTSPAATSTSNLPGVDNDLVIPSSPVLIKENSQYPSKKTDLKKK